MEIESSNLISLATIDSFSFSEFEVSDDIAATVYNASWLLADITTSEVSSLHLGLPNFSASTCSSSDCSSLLLM